MKIKYNSLIKQYELEKVNLRANILEMQGIRYKIDELVNRYIFTYPRMLNI